MTLKERWKAQSTKIGKFLIWFSIGFAALVPTITEYLETLKGFPDEIISQEWKMYIGVGITVLGLIGKLSVAKKVE